MSLFNILVAAVIVFAFVGLVIQLVSDAANDRRRPSDPDAPTASTGSDFSADAHHSGGGHQAHHDSGTHHTGDFGGGGHHG
jgi:hypothetical protein